MSLTTNFKIAQDVLKDFSTPENFKKIELAASWIIETLKKDGKVISCGNGGSMCDAMHFAEEMTGRYQKNRPALAAVSISDPSHITCVANDYGYEFIFSRYVDSVGRTGDLLLAISTSGNSENVIKAIESAKAKNIKTIALTGKDGGKIASLVDLEIRVPYAGFADRIQEIHIKIIHNLIQLVEQAIYPELCK
ncbi:MAG: D-sedoheptulose 7-phosphate isomerase [Bacteroidetes bacterium]|nr:D-sedoheptulose 7-phosphate isomerase [Bacteroidota bacterium]